MKKLFFLLALFCSVTILSAQSINPQHERALAEINRRGEVYFSFQLNDLSQISLLTQKISISNFKENIIFAYANQKEFSDFCTLGIDFEVLTAPSELYPVKMSDNSKQLLTWNYYPTYSAYETLMLQFATDHPDICKLLTITTLGSGRKLLALKISDNINIQENEPEFLYTSSLHGDELTGYILMLHLADYLLSGYGTDNRITDLINNFELVICPLANPDGTYKGGNNSVNGATRGNANNVDLNRNYPDPKRGPHPDGNAWQPENVALMNFAGFYTFTMGANFHGGAEVVNYPWDTWSKLAADDAWWIYTSREYADTVHTYSPAGYMTMMMNGITNGFAWYEVSGGHQDYMNYFRNCRETTIELSDTKLLPESQLLPHWEYNYRSLINYIEQAGYGLHGLVTDSISGAPLSAKVYISGFDKDSSHVYTDPQVGDYHRLLKGGSYNVTFSSTGYQSKTITVQVADKQKTTLDVQLYDGRLASNFSADTNSVAVDQNVQFFDNSAGHPQSWNWTFSGGIPATSVEANPIVSYAQPGMYPVKLVVSRPGSVDSLVRDQYIEVKPWYLMGNKSYTVCDARFFDTGGPATNYSSGESSVISFYPANETKKLTAYFHAIDIEDGGSDCINDKLKIFDGASVNDYLISTLCGTSLPGKITASNPTGVLTFQFESNGSNAYSGWDITISCDSNVGITENLYHQVRIYPNPVSEGQIKIETSTSVQTLVVRDLTGKVIHFFSPFSNSFSVECNWSSGIYLLQMQIEDKWISRKIQVFNN